MQYLSKAYNYYSGINPATLSGAIDVIIIRHVGDDGEVTMSSSPFHVRFGKLQVLRAGEKRVTITLPDNLPAPHVAPFSMKVGDTGEAFFVLETEEEVPPELITSPVVMPDDEASLILPPSPPMSLEGAGAGEEQSPTHHPFGESDKAGQKIQKRPLSEVEFLDLNATTHHEFHPPNHSPNHHPNTPSTGRPLSSVSITDSASSFGFEPRLKSDSTSVSSDTSHMDVELRPKPHITNDISSEGHLYDEDKRKLERENEGDENGHALSGTDDQQVPPNPMAAQPGEETHMPFRDHKLSDMYLSPNPNEDGLPKVKPGEGEGPTVVYGKDVILDMAGYHSSRANEDVTTPTERTSKSALLHQGNDPSEKSKHSIAPSLRNSLVDSLTRNLLGAVLPRPHMLPRSTDPDLNETQALLSNMTHMSLEDRSRRERHTSEPPPDIEPTSPSSLPLSRSPSGTIFPPSLPIPHATMDLAWDWGRLPAGRLPAGHKPPDDVEEVDNLEPPALERAQSLPPENMDSPVQPPWAPSVRLKNVEDSPYVFVLELEDSRTYTFELALCGHEGFAPGGKASEEDEAAFLRTRVSFQEFIEDPQLVDDPRLVLRYSLMYLTWTNEYPLLRALSLYRQTLAPPHINTPSTPPVRPVSGYGWSRWWRGNPTSGPTPQPQPQHAASTSDVTLTPITSGNGAPQEHPQPSFESTQPTHRKNYAKTLRLSSDQLKSLNLKPGPNTIYFSATSSYSGQAICSARIFLWEETDQIVISDIDGTITKSDALGHVFAAIGKDWTHLGIAKLYTDISNNGYKIMYLTSRAIGQADSTREYLKGIVQGEYRLPDGPVIMSPDRLIASLHREVILRKPELFKMACLRDIQRLFGRNAKDAFFAGFGNRITDAMSYRSVGIPASKIYTIDSTGVVKTELLQAAGHKGSYIQLNDLVNETFPPVNKKFIPDYTDFIFWRPLIEDVPIPDLTPPSPALSARAETTSRLSVLGKIATLGRRSSRAMLPGNDTTVRSGSGLGRAAVTPSDLLR
ncbi:hypothetical protein M231_01659 [Tremella mesenterica]|uniref:phosphatidate phosphatase n=1 Tax=Tremella mesenterica TaxID=5217 RepID=A0A4Q1BST7_TREME|nr:hypothetical protein M231_01659 [Tremella mesenterica]